MRWGGVIVPMDGCWLGLVGLFLRFWRPVDVGFLNISFFFLFCFFFSKIPQIVVLQLIFTPPAITCQLYLIMRCRTKYVTSSILEAFILSIFPLSFGKRRRERHGYADI